MTDQEAAEGAERMTDMAVSTAYPDAIGRQFDLEACAYALERAQAYRDSAGHGVNHPLTRAYEELARQRAKLLKPQTQRLLSAALTATI